MESLDATVDGSILYLFGFIARPAAIAPLDGMEPGAPVFLVESGDLACAACRVPACAFGAAIDASRPEQAEWLAHHAWRHHEVLSRLHESVTVLPLKFGTLCPDVTVARGILEARHATIASLLDRFAGVDEWTLKISVDEEGIASQLEAESPVLRQMRSAESGMSDGQAFFARRVRLKTTAGLVAAAVAAVHSQVFDYFSRLGIDMVKNGGGAALLVDRAGFGALHQALSALEAAHASSGAAFELVGPLPPYSFVRALELGRE